MTTSYKIVLLGAFVLFAGVIAYVVLSSGGTPDAASADDNNPPSNANADAAPPRTTLDTQPPPKPPAPQVTIGPTEDDIPDFLRPADPTPGLDTTNLTDIGFDNRPAPLARTPRDSEPLGTGVTGTGEGTPTDPSAEPNADNSAAEATTPGTGESVATGEGRPGPGSEPATPPASDTDTNTAEAEPEPAAEEEKTTRPVPPTPRTASRTYTVKSGDTFASIALEVYGEESAWFEIAQANPSVDPKRLQVDQVIVLPERDQIVRDREEVTPPAPGKDQTYTVRPGDNLSRIAKRFYNDTEAWDLIYNRNRDKIGPSPDRLKAGMVLIIPQAYSGAQ